MNHFLEFKDDDNYLLEDGEVDPVLLTGFGFNEIDDEQIQLFNYNANGGGPVDGFELPERPTADTRSGSKDSSSMSNSSSKPRLIKRGRGRPRKNDDYEDDVNFNVKKVKASDSNSKKTRKYNINYNVGVKRARNSPSLPPPKPIEPEPEPEFKCSICDRVYKYLEHLENHLEIIHFTKIKSKVVCKECDQEFFRLMDLYEHEKQEHSKKAKKGANLNCNYCDEFFTTYHLKKKHMIIMHNYVPSTSSSSNLASKDKNDIELTECSICFFSFEDIGKHIQNEHEHLNDIDVNQFDDNLETEADVASNSNTTTTTTSTSTSTINSSTSTSEPLPSTTSTGTGVICKVCNTTFVSLRVLEIHERIIHKNLIEYASSS